MYNVVFAITSKGNDSFSNMTRLAIASIRISNPEFLITLACDQETNIAIIQENDPILREVDFWKVVNTPSGDDCFRNRFVKTSLRKVIEGPFLFLDSDILVRGDLRPIFNFNVDIAGARNHSMENIMNQIWIKDQEILDKMNWQVNDNVYINGGVMFYNNTPKAYLFAETWHNKWLQVWNIHKSYRDQPALNATLAEISPKLVVLEDKYNAQYKMNFKASIDAHIWHSYSSDPNSNLNDFFALGLQIINDPIALKDFQQKLVNSRIPLLIDSKKNERKFIKLVVQEDMNYCKALEIASQNKISKIKLICNHLIWLFLSFVIQAKKNNN